jgi:hypothetical protein
MSAQLRRCTIAAYERFLELPRLVVLVVMWLMGALLLGAAVLALHYAWTILG